MPNFITPYTDFASSNSLYHFQPIQWFKFYKWVRLKASYIKNSLKPSALSQQGRIQGLERGMHFVEKLKRKKKKVTAIIASLYQMYLL